MTSADLVHDAGRENASKSECRGRREGINNQRVALNSSFQKSNLTRNKRSIKSLIYKYLDMKQNEVLRDVWFVDWKLRYYFKNKKYSETSFQIDNYLILETCFLSTHCNQFFVSPEFSRNLKSSYKIKGSNLSTAQTKYI